MRIIKTAVIAGMISLLTSFSSFAEKVKLEIQVGQAQLQLQIYLQQLSLTKWVVKQN